MRLYDISWMIGHSTRIGFPRPPPSRNMDNTDGHDSGDAITSGRDSRVLSPQSGSPGGIMEGGGNISRRPGLRPEVGNQRDQRSGAPPNSQISISVSLISKGW
jgi:hypothetical protein